MMSVDKHIITELKNAILKSRYQAARLVNRELVVLYFDIGRRISVNANEEAWGSKVLDQISDALQDELPGLHSFSASNLKKKRVFAEFWGEYLTISSAMPNQLKNGKEVISSAMPNQLPENFLDIFFSVGFTHHYNIASKCNEFKEAFFYLSKVAAEFWDYRRLETDSCETILHAGNIAQ